MQSNCCKIDELIESCRQEMPPVFELVSLDQRTGGALKHRTIHNRRSRREIPAEIFLRQGRKILVHRDLLLLWWKSQLQITD